MEASVRNRVALVTGAASGIGAAVSRRLSALGARLALLDVDTARGEALATELDAVFVRCDVADRAAWFAALAQCIDRVGVPDHAHLNAGVMSVPADAPLQSIDRLAEASVRRIVDINLGGVVFGLQALLPHMRERPGSICVTASLAGLVPLPVDPLYAATKHALVGLVRSVAAAGEGSPLRVNAICPGGVDTAIVPAALRQAGMELMPVDLLAEDVVDLLANGANGEIRLHRSARLPAVAVPVPEFE
ncbi:MAG: SDR family NAD(P)-dependent oxidoreductase [Pseudomonadales bacterium]